MLFASMSAPMERSVDEANVAGMRCKLDSAHAILRWPSGGGDGCEEWRQQWHKRRMQEIDLHMVACIRTLIQRLSNVNSPARVKMENWRTEAVYPLSGACGEATRRLLQCAGASGTHETMGGSATWAVGLLTGSMAPMSAPFSKRCLTTAVLLLRIARCSGVDPCAANAVGSWNTRLSGQQRRVRGRRAGVWVCACGLMVMRCNCGGFEPPGGSKRACHAAEESGSRCTMFVLSST